MGRDVGTDHSFPSVSSCFLQLLFFSYFLPMLWMDYKNGCAMKAPGEAMQAGRHSGVGKPPSQLVLTLFLTTVCLENSGTCAAV